MYLGSISSTGGRCVNLVPVDTSDAEFRKVVDFSLLMAFQVFNKDFQLGSDMYAASQDLRELVKDFWKQIDEEFMPRNSLKIPPSENHPERARRGARKS